MTPLVRRRARGSAAMSITLMLMLVSTIAVLYLNRSVLFEQRTAQCPRDIGGPRGNGSRSTDALKDDPIGGEDALGRCGRGGYRGSGAVTLRTRWQHAVLDTTMVSEGALEPFELAGPNHAQGCIAIIAGDQRRKDVAVHDVASHERRGVTEPGHA